MQPPRSLFTPIGNAAKGRFSDQWKGPGFTRLRVEMRSVLLKNPSRFEPETYTTNKKQCVEPGMCYLKNMYFRGDEDFYARLGRAMAWARRRSRWKRTALTALAGAQAGVRRVLGHARG